MWILFVSRHTNQWQVNELWFAWTAGDFFTSWVNITMSKGCSLRRHLFTYAL